MPTNLLDDDQVSSIDPPDGDGGGGDDDSIHWVTVASFWQPTEAHIARLKLESEGIACLIVDENVATNWLGAPAIGGVRLQVPDKSSNEAKAILGVHAPAEAPPVSLPFGACPECGSQHIIRPWLQPQVIWAAVVALLLFGIPLALPFALAGFVYYLIAWRPWRCQDCGNTFHTAGDPRRGFPVIVPGEKENPRSSQGSSE